MSPKNNSRLLNLLKGSLSLRIRIADCPFITLKYNFAEIKIIVV